MAYATITDVNNLFRSLTNSEQTKAQALLPIVEDLIRQEAQNVGKDLDAMVENGFIYENTIKSVIVDVVARTLMTSTSQEPMTQFSESALGYSVSGSFLSPGGGIFIKKSELRRLGINKARLGYIDQC